MRYGWLLLGLWSCGGPRGAQLETPRFDPKLQTKCRVAKSNAHPLAVRVRSQGRTDGWRREETVGRQVQDALAAGLITKGLLGGRRPTKDMDVAAWLVLGEQLGKRIDLLARAR